MHLQKYFEELRQVQESLLVFLDNQTNTEGNFQNLINILDNLKIREDRHKTMSILHLILEIANNHYRYPNFFTKIDQVLQLFKDCVKNFFSNSEIFNIFQSNKRVLLFLFNEQILRMDANIINKMRTKKFELMGYPPYFAPEIKPFINEKWFQKKIQDEEVYWNNKKLEDFCNELPENFYENRERGESESKLLKLIREDSMIEFVKFTNSNEIDLHMEIELSMYETNSLFIDFFNNNQNRIYDYVPVNLIAYAAFFGSLQIFNYLLNKGVRNHYLLKFAIHGANTRIFRIIENAIDFTEFAEESFNDAIRYHNNYFALFIRSNYVYYARLYTYVALKYYNFYFVEPHQIDNRLIGTLCLYGYNNLVQICLKNGRFDINEPVNYYVV